MTQIVDNITLLPNLYKEEEDIVILTETEKEIEEAFSKVVRAKTLLNREKKIGKSSLEPNLTKKGSMFGYLFLLSQNG